MGKCGRWGFVGVTGGKAGGYLQREFQSILTGEFSIFMEQEEVRGS